MNRSRAYSLPLLVLLSSLAAAPCLAAVLTEDEGRWPQDWPAQLERFRDRSQTICVATGLQMDIYQIPFESREEFEHIWPVIVGLKSKGGTLTLSGLNAEEKNWPSISNEKPTVRIYAPALGWVTAPEPDAASTDKPREPLTYEEIQDLVKAGKALNTTPPWPDSAYLPNGQLPEYVRSRWVDDRLTWAPAEADDKSAGFLHRARVDIELVVDGNVIDLNRIPLPQDTPIIDNRVLQPPTAAE